ncbi:MAG: RNA polymerase sigma factor [Gemmataceae bacterium]
MSERPDSPSGVLQSLLLRLAAGDPAARQELLDRAGARLRQLTRAMLRDYARLRRWEGSDDVLQGALMRLHRALDEARPPTPRDFYRLAALQVRRELIDLARRYFGPEGLGTRHESAVHAAAAPPEPAASSQHPGRLDAWTELHQRAGELPEEQREAFDLLWYQGLSADEAGEVLGVSGRTVKRRWQAACLALHAALGNDLPSL